MTTGDLARLEDELAGVAREIAKVLTNPPIDDATLAELDRRAGELRQRVSEARPPRAPDTIQYGSRLMLSGG
ncbi:MAG TPA: hypothetical protein VFJ82_15130 [Longimicrobium sp.]|nr:hypothetical protein [Longimicrobium sp.]